MSDLATTESSTSDLVTTESLTSDPAPSERVAPTITTTLSPTIGVATTPAAGTPTNGTHDPFHLNREGTLGVPRRDTGRPNRDITRSDDTTSPPTRSDDVSARRAATRPDDVTPQLSANTEHCRAQNLKLLFYRLISSFLGTVLAGVAVWE